MRRLLALTLTVLLLAGCALRPRYAQFVNKNTQGKEVQLQLLERSTGKPVAGASIEVGEYRMRVVTRTDARGLFALPIDRRYLDDNAIIAVNPPAGVGTTQMVLVEPVFAVPVAVPVVPVIVDVDAGRL